MGRTLLSDAFDFDLDFDLGPDSDFDLDVAREGHGFSRAEKLPTKSTRLHPLRLTSPRKR